MTPERLQDIRRVFESVAELPAGERMAILSKARERDPALVAEVEQLVEAHHSRTGFIEQPALDLHTFFAPEEAEAELAGNRIGSYEIAGELGHGGMGTVYEATRIDGSFRKRVAIKVIRAELLTEGLRERFRQERQILAGLDHPNIARILDGGTTESGRPYFVMEYVAGVRIDRYCRDHRLGVGLRLDLFLRVCDAVQYAHDHLIVHRDLKPGNILVTPEGEVKLLDFGIAKLLTDPGDPQPASTATSAMVLTPDYASPEQVLGKPITTATDVYLLGVLLYELLAGLHPIRSAGTVPHDVMRAVCEQEPVRPSAAMTLALAERETGGGADFRKLRRELRGELDHIVLMALQKEPARRYSSVAQFRSDIERYRDGRPVVAQGDRLSYRAAKFLRRHVIPVTAAALILLALVAATVVSLRQASWALREQRGAEQERRIANIQRRLAQSQQVRAEQQTAEAEQQRERADAERQRAEKRFDDIRSLATTLLFDLHDGIRDLAGSASARKLVLAKAQQYLEVLSKESGDDLQLQGELATAYEKTGDLLTDAIGLSTTDGSALASYNKALQLREAIARRKEPDLRDQRALAYSLMKVSNGHFLHGETSKAVEDCQRAFEMQQKVLLRDTSDAESRRVMGYIQNRRCIVLAASGDALHAREACGASALYLEPFAGAPPGDKVVRRVLASTWATYGNLLRNLKELPESLRYLDKATGLYETLAAEQPNNVEYRRLASYTQIYIALARMAQNDHAGAMAAYSKAVASMQMLLSIDPSDAKAPFALAFALMKMSDQMKKIGDHANAEKAAAQALELERAVAERPAAGPFEWNEYANGLVKADFASLKQPAKALDLALRAAHGTKESDPIILDTLAWAYFQSGDSPAAIRTERKALILVPASNALGQGLRNELEQGLAKFEASPK
jgi:eukaryotic-like serine/threonine-protein kinase